MRIRIEIDGRTVLDTNVGALTEGSSARLYLQDEQPPEELLREARARGAHSAGRAAYVQEAGTALSSPALSADLPAASVTGPRTKLDAEAGRAVAVEVTSRTRGAAKSGARKKKK